MDEGVGMVGKRQFYFRINPVNTGWVSFGILLHFCLTLILQSDGLHEGEWTDARRPAGPLWGFKYKETRGNWFAL